MVPAIPAAAQMGHALVVREEAPRGVGVWAHGHRGESSTDDKDCGAVG